MQKLWYNKSWDEYMLVSKEDYQEAVNKTKEGLKRPLVVHFTARRCGLCKPLSPGFEMMQ